MKIGRGVAATLLLVVGSVPDSAAEESSERREPDDVRWSRAIGRLESPQVSVRRSATATLERLVKMEGFAEDVQANDGVWAIQQDLACLASQAARKDQDAAVRADLIRVLGMFPVREYARGAIDPLVEMLLDENDEPALRRAIIQWLAPVGSCQPLRDATLRMTRSPTEEIREAAYRAFGMLEIDPATYLRFVQRGFADPSPIVRRAALDSVADLAAKGDSRAVTVLLRAFHEADPVLHIGALSGLKRLGPGAREAIDDLVETLEHGDPALRVNVAAILCDMTGDLDRYLPIFVDALKSKDPRVWRLAAALLMFSPLRERMQSEVPALNRTLGISEPDVQVRLAVVLAAVTRRTDGYAPLINQGLASTDRETRQFAATWGRFLERRPVSLASPGLRALFAGLMVSFTALLGFIVYARNDGKRFFRGLGNGRDRLRVVKLPRRLHLRARAQLPWRDETAVMRHVESLRALGFRDVGPLEVEEVPALRIWGLVRPEEALVAEVCEHDDLGLFLGLSTEYYDGTLFTVGTLSPPNRLELPPWRMRVHVATKDASVLYRRLLDDRPSRPARPIAAEEFITRFERAHADHVDWRYNRGGMTVGEIRPVSAAKPSGADEQSTSEHWALHELDRSLRERFLDQSGCSESEREQIAARLLAIHDGLPLAWVAEVFLPMLDDEYQATSVAEASGPHVGPAHEGPFPWQELPARTAFALLNRRLAAPDRYVRIGAVDRPVAADLYLAPVAAAAADLRCRLNDQIAP